MTGQCQIVNAFGQEDDDWVEDLAGLSEHPHGQQDQVCVAPKSKQNSQAGFKSVYSWSIHIGL